MFGSILYTKYSTEFVVEVQKAVRPNSARGPKEKQRQSDRKQLLKKILI
jgi:hypothetical protein